MASTVSSYDGSIVSTPQQLVRPDEVGDEVVYHAAVVGAAQRVLGVPRRDPAEVGCQATVGERGGTRPGQRQLAQVAHVEDADGLADGGVLGDSARRVRDRHRPPAEGTHRGAEGAVPVVQRAGAQVVGHAGEATGRPPAGRAA